MASVVVLACRGAAGRVHIVLLLDSEFVAIHRIGVLSRRCRFRRANHRKRSCMLCCGEWRIGSMWCCGGLQGDGISSFFFSFSLFLIPSGVFSLLMSCTYYFFLSLLTELFHLISMCAGPSPRCLQPNTIQSSTQYTSTSSASLRGTTGILS